MNNNPLKERYSHLLELSHPFLGREQEIQRVSRLLRSPYVHLLTLTGMGGVGKTRLALQVAKTLFNEFADGIYFVSLAPINNPALVLPAIAQTFNIGEAGEQSLLERIQAHIQDKSLLLLLDNFEQVITAEVSELRTRSGDERNLSPPKPQKGDNRRSFSLFLAHFWEWFPHFAWTFQVVS